jgi:hypothetical protein
MRRNKTIGTDQLPQSLLAKLDNGNKNDIFNYPAKQISKLLDSTNIVMVSELLNDPSISSLTLANKLDIPLSTLQRRRARIENALLR